MKNSRNNELFQENIKEINLEDSALIIAQRIYKRMGFFTFVIVFSFFFLFQLGSDFSILERLSYSINIGIGARALLFFIKKFHVLKFPLEQRKKLWETIGGYE